MVAHITGVVNCDTPVAMCWNWFLRQSWHTEPLLEAGIAATAFFSWIMVFRTLDSMPFGQQFRFIPRPWEMSWTKAIHESLDNALSQTPTSRDRRALRVLLSFPVYLFGIWLLHLVRQPRPIEEASPTFLRVVAELVFGIWAYDFVFYWFHLGMHKLPSCLNILHGHSAHHELSETRSKPRICFMNAEAVVNHSLFDGALQVAVNIFVQCLAPWGVPKHKFSRLLHNILVTYLLTEAHSGMDLPWGSHRLCPWILGGAPRHEAHHHVHKGCFHQFFKYIDDVLGYGPPPGWE